MLVAGLVRVQVGALAPWILAQPESLTVRVGQKASFFLAATGTPNLFIQWRKDGDVLVAETNATLTLTNVQFTDAGTYDALVTNDQGVVVSEPATLAVLAKAEPTSRLSVVRKGGLICFAGFGWPGASYVIEVSTNLVNWRTFRELITDTGCIEFVDPQQATAAQRFFRARRVE